MIEKYFLNTFVSKDLDILYYTVTPLKTCSRNDVRIFDTAEDLIYCMLTKVGVIELFTPTFNILHDDFILALGERGIMFQPGHGTGCYQDIEAKYFCDEIRIHAQSAYIIIARTQRIHQPYSLISYATNEEAETLRYLDLEAKKFKLSDYLEKFINISATYANVFRRILIETPNSWRYM